MRLGALPAAGAAILFALAGCTSSDAPLGDQLGAPLPTPALAQAATGGQAVPADVEWSTAVPEEFRKGAGVFALGPWFVLSAIAESDQGTGVNSRLFIGRSSDGKQMAVREIPSTLSQPFVFLERGRPMALANQQADPEAAGTLVKLDLLSGRRIWEQPSDLGRAAVTGSQFRAVGIFDGAVIGQVVARTKHHASCAVCAIRLRDGHVLWRQSGKVMAAGIAQVSTVVGHGMVATELGELDSSTAYLLDAGTGRRISRFRSTWTIDTMAPPMVLTEQGMVELGSPGTDGLRRAVAVDRGGHRTWEAQLRPIPVLVDDRDTVVLPMADGSYVARTVASTHTRWTIPRSQAADDRFVLMLSLGDRLMGNTANSAVVLDSRTGKPIYADWFEQPNPAQWDGERFLGWDHDGALTSYLGSKPPVGVQRDAGGEVPVFVAD